MEGGRDTNITLAVGTSSNRPFFLISVGIFEPKETSENENIYSSHLHLPIPTGWAWRIDYITTRVNWSNFLRTILALWFVAVNIFEVELVSIYFSSMGDGTDKSSHRNSYDLEQTEKSVSNSPGQTNCKAGNVIRSQEPAYSKVQNYWAIFEEWKFRRIERHVWTPCLPSLFFCYEWPQKNSEIHNKSMESRKSST